MRNGIVLHIVFGLATATLACGGNQAGATSAPAPSSTASGEPPAACPPHADPCPAGCEKIGDECVKKKGIIAPQ